MLTQGFRLIYLNEVLSTGESTRTYIDFIDRRLRWLQGNFQVYFYGKDIPIWSKLNWIQKSYSVSQLIYCFQPVLRAVFLLAPLCSAYLGISPFIATLPEVLYYFLPFWLLHIVVYGWATNYRVSYFWNEVYETIFCFPALKRLWLIVRTPFAKASQATRKGIKADRKNYNFNRTLPLIILLALSGLTIGLRLVGLQFGVWLTFDESAAVLIFWLLYRTHLGSIQTARRLSMSRIKQRLSLAVAWSRVRSKFLTRLLQRSIQALVRSMTQRVATGTNPVLPVAIFSVGVGLGASSNLILVMIWG